MLVMMDFLQSGKCGVDCKLIQRPVCQSQGAETSITTGQ